MAARIPAVVLLVSLWVPSGAQVRSQEKEKDKGESPTIVVRVQSLNALLQNLNLVIRLVGQEEAANQTLTEIAESESNEDALGEIDVKASAKSGDGGGKSRSDAGVPAGVGGQP